MIYNQYNSSKYVKDVNYKVKKNPKINYNKIQYLYYNNFN